ncbi:MAG: hypothetical protein M3Q71_21775 [Chloroflexota bacterium]|nr:hypothetical protein [Chloroflexota bacterium]
MSAVQLRHNRRAFPGHLTALGDGALGEAIRQAMNGRRLGDAAPCDLTEEERPQVQAVVAE